MMHAPQIPGLKVIQILEESKRHTDIDADMPNLKDSKFPNRDLVINVGKDKLCIMSIAKSILPEVMQKMVYNAMEQREDKFVKKRNLTMKFLPKFLQMFSDSKELPSINSIGICYRTKRKISWAG